MKKIMMIAAMVISSSVFAAPPKVLVTHNNTDEESNAYVAGVIPSQFPTRAHSESRVIWTSVRMACYGHVVNGKCPAVIKMATNTPNPVVIGEVSLDLNTGELTPSQIHGNGYTFTVIGPGESTITKD